jgi:predicted permease
VRHAVRHLARELLARPGVTLVAVATLGLGIGVNTVIFSGVQGLLWQPLPYPHAERLALLREKAPGGELRGLSLGELESWRASNPAFEALGASAGWAFNVATSTAAEPQRIHGSVVTRGLLEMLDAGPVVGRGFDAGSFQDATRREVLLGHPLWRRLFQADPGVVGRTILVDGRERTVRGVLPDDFRYPFRAELWMPLSPAERARDLATGAPSYTVLGRLRPGLDATRAGPAMSATLPEGDPVATEPRELVVTSLGESRVAPRYREAALVMQTAVGLVLLIACGNLASLLLARQEERHREFAVRKSLGADRGRLLRQLLAETLALGILGCGLGLLLARWGLAALRAVVAWPAVGVPEPGLNAKVLLAALAVSLATSLAVGIVPGLRAGRQDVQLCLRAGSGSEPGRSARTGWLVAAQMSLGMALALSAALSIRSFLDLAVQSPGFEPAGAVTLAVHAPHTGAGAAAGPDLSRLIDAVGDLPGVEAVGAVGYMPLVGYNPGTPFLIDGPAGDDLERAPRVDYQAIAGEYFAAVGIPLLQGRLLEQTERTADPPVAVLVNQRLARRFWPDRSGLGRTVWLPEWAGSSPVTVVGVVGDVSQHGLGREALPEVYVPGFRSGLTTIVARAGPRVGEVSAAVAAELGRRRGDGAVYELGTLEQLVADHLEKRRVFVTLLGVFAGMALGLAALGVYSTSAFAVARRTRELGIRMALGALPRDVLRSVLARCLGIGLVGVVVGSVASLAAGDFLRRLIYGVVETDVLFLAGLAAGGLALSVAAGYLPALRAARCDPATVLRGD